MNKALKTLLHVSTPTNPHQYPPSRNRVPPHRKGDKKERKRVMQAHRILHKRTHHSTSQWQCSEIRARYHPNPTPDRWPLESLPLGSETGIQVSAVVGIGDHLGRQLPVSLLVPVSVASVDTTLLPTKF